MKDSGALAIWRLHGAGDYTSEVPVAACRDIVKTCGCDAMSRMGGNSWVGGRQCRSRSSRLVFVTDPRLDVRRRVLPVGGAKLREKAQGPPFRPEERPGEGKAGRANVNEPFM